MVMTKGASTHHHQSSVKEIMVPSPGRLMSRRIPELPSLRYGSLGAKSAVSGPLRVSNHYRSETLPRTNSKKVKNVYRDDVSSCKPSRPARRVRFTLPSSDGDTGRSDAEFIPATTIATPTANLTVKRTTAGDSNYPKTRVTPISTRADSKQGNHHYNNTTIQNNRSQIGYRHSTASSSAFFGENSVRYNRITLHRRDSLTNGANHHHSYFYSNYNNHDRHYYEQHLHKLQQEQEERDLEDTVGVFVPVTASPAVRTRVHPTGKYIRGTLSPTANTAAHAAPTSPGGQLLLRAARDAEDGLLRDVLRRAQLVGITDSDLNATDNSGRTALSYIASNGSVETLDQILQLPNLDPNISDNEGNTPLHFAAQAGQVECLNCMLTRCRGIEIDARNNLGFTPLMKAALQGRNKCAKLLLFAGANPTLRDNGRGLRADQWARFCGRYVCADVIEKLARQRLLERSASYGNWGSEIEVGSRILMGKVVPVPNIPQQTSHGIKSKLRKVFRTSSGPSHNNDNLSSARLVTQLTSAALCASTPALPSAPNVPPIVKSLIRPLTVPRLQITLVNNNNNENSNLTNGLSKSQTNINEVESTAPVIKPTRTKKKK